MLDFAVEFPDKSEQLEEICMISECRKFVLYDLTVDMALAGMQESVPYHSALGPGYGEPAD